MHGLQDGLQMNIMNSDRELEEKYTEITGNKYLYKDDFHPDIKMVHFTNSLNKPHEWSQYQYYA